MLGYFEFMVLIKSMDSWTLGKIKSWTLDSRSHGLMDSLGLYDTTKQLDPLVLFIFSMGRYLLFDTLASWTHEQVDSQTQGKRLMRTLGSCGLVDSWVMDSLGLSAILTMACRSI